MTTPTLSVTETATTSSAERTNISRSTLHETELVILAPESSVRQKEIRTETEAPVASEQLDYTLAPPPIDRIYPHVFDESESAGQAVALIRQAHKDASTALDAYGEADLEAVESRLTLIAAAASKAYPLSDFNRSFAAVVAYIRRAALFANAAGVTRQALNALAHALQFLLANPMIDLMDAAEITEKLSAVGWHGEHQATEQLIDALLGELSTGEATQAEQFRKTLDSSGRTL
jgi:hypothetical protein